MYVLFVQGKFTERVEAKLQLTQPVAEVTKGKSQAASASEESHKQQEFENFKRNTPWINVVDSLHMRLVHCVQPEGDDEAPWTSEYSDFVMESPERREAAVQWLTKILEHYEPVLAMGFEPSLVLRAFYFDCIDAGMQLPPSLWPMELSAVEYCDIEYVLSETQDKPSVIGRHQLLKYAVPAGPDDLGQELHTYPEEEMLAAFRLATQYQLYPGSQQLAEVCLADRPDNIDALWMEELNHLDPLCLLEQPVLESPKVKWNNVKTVVSHLQVWRSWSLELAKLLDKITDVRSRLITESQEWFQSPTATSEANWKTLRYELEVYSQELESWLEQNYQGAISQLVSRYIAPTCSTTATYILSAERKSLHFLKFYLNNDGELVQTKYIAEMADRTRQTLELAETQGQMLFDMLHKVGA